MTDHATLLQLLGQWVTVTHPDARSRVWHGQLASLMDSPSVVLQMPEGGTMVLPQSFDVQGAPPAPGGPHPDPDSQALPFDQLRDSGLLWLINRTALHPRGLSLAIHYDEHSQAYGWSLVGNSDGEPWQFDVATDNDGYVRAERTIAAALAGLPAAPDAPRCAVCGGSPIAYENDQDQKFCAGCVSCSCGQETCALAKQPANPVPPVPPAGLPVAGHPCTAEFNEGFHGRAHCQSHPDPDSVDGAGFQHEGRSQDGSTIRWNDGDRGATPHRPDGIRTHPDERPDADVRMGGVVRTASDIGETACALTCPDGIRMRPDADVSVHPDDIRMSPDGGGDTITRSHAQMTIAQVMDVPVDLLGEDRCDCGQTGPLLNVASDGSHWHMPPAEYEKRQTGDVHPAIKAWGECEQRTEALRTRLALARQILVDDGYFTDDQVGDDLAPRLVEWISAQRSRVWELADTLGTVLDLYRALLTGDTKHSDEARDIAMRQTREWYNLQQSVRDPGTVVRPLCLRADCINTRNDRDRALKHFDGLRTDRNTAARYIRQQQQSGFPLRGGDNRWRVLATLATWNTETGPLRLDSHR